MSDLSGRRVHPMDLSRQAGLQDQFREDPRAAADVEPTRNGRWLQPFEKHRPDRPAPATHETFIGLAVVE